MAERDGYPHGVPGWIDLGTSDVEGARAFYSALFGWESEDLPTDDMNMTYTMFSKKGKAVAGMGPIPPGMEGTPPVWSTYVNVDSVDDTVAKAEAAGGSVVMPAMDVMTAGRMAFVADPTGAAFGLWEARDHKGAGLVNEDGTLTWNELMTDDVAAAEAFYTAALGWGVQKDDMPGGFVYTTYKVGDAPVAGMMAKQPGMEQIPNNWGVYFAVDDCDGCAARITELGGTLMQPPFDTPIGKMAVASDPQGAAFMVITFAQPGE
jgi:predicted enzyme related to lactoylglutathione lyase